MSDTSDRSEDRPLVDDLAEQSDDLQRETGGAGVAGGLQDDEPKGDSYEERDRREGGRA